MISLVTYTYNDHEFVIRQIKKALQLMPLVSEIIVVDDGSNQQFHFDTKNKIITLHHEINKGPAEAKKTGMNAASGEYILSVDCDIDFSQQWLRTSLQYLSENSVGLVGAKVINKNYGDHLSKALYYQSMNGVCSNRFACGGLWLIKREYFRTLGGLDGYSGRTHEDWYFSCKVIESGMKISINEAHPVTQLRRLKRKQHIMRECLYLENCYKSILTKREPKIFLEIIKNEIESAVDVANKFDCHMLVYIKMTKFIRILGDMYGIYKYKVLMKKFIHSIKEAFIKYPVIKETIRNDCDMGISDVNIGIIESYINDMICYICAIIGDEILSKIDGSILPESIAEENMSEYDFHYIN